VEKIVRRYLRCFVTGDLAELAAVVAEDVRIHGAGADVQGRHHVERAVRQPGLRCTDVEVHELLTARDRVVVYFTQHLVHEPSGKAVTVTGLKMYRVADGRVVEFWGETDLYGLMRQLGKVPAEVTFVT
jgi:predicted ester cyclase